MAEKNGISLSPQNANILMFTIIGGALGNAAWSYAESVPWIGERRGHLIMLSLLMASGMVAYTHRQTIQSTFSGAPMMQSKLDRKRPRMHPEVQNRDIGVDGFVDFSFKAFSNAYEKSAAPLSKRRNGQGPTHHGLGGMVETVQTHAEMLLVITGLYALWRYVK